MLISSNYFVAHSYTSIIRILSIFFHLNKKITILQKEIIPLKYGLHFFYFLLFFMVLCCSLLTQLCQNYAKSIRFKNELVAALKIEEFIFCLSLYYLVVYLSVSNLVILRLDYSYSKLELCKDLTNDF